MSRVLIADTPKGAVTLQRILKGHECIVVTTMGEVEAKLKTEAFDLIIAGLHFDDSQMFELIQEVKKAKRTLTSPSSAFVRAILKCLA